jgi:hypothetical protein
MFLNINNEMYCCCLSIEELVYSMAQIRNTPQEDESRNSFAWNIWAACSSLIGLKIGERTDSYSFVVNKNVKRFYFIFCWLGNNFLLVIYTVNLDL